jgi:beta-glucosidase
MKKYRGDWISWDLAINRKCYENMNKALTAVSGIILAAMIYGGCGVKKDSRNESTVLDRKVDSVLALMTLEEKLGQLTLYTSSWDVTGPVMNPEYKEEVRAGRCGNIFNAHTAEYNRGLQKIAVEETRLGIPLLFGYDVVHGHRTIFPIPLAEACSWNPELMKRSAELSAKEAAASGLNWTFAPVVDISRDPRWGRVSEGFGEDTYLSGCIAGARVKGFQGSDLADSNTLAACIKHFAAYGAPVAGKDYNTVDMSEISFRQDYLPPYRKGVEAGAATVMASFNDLFGVPATASRYLLTGILRGEWGFTGLVVSDYDGVNQLQNHGVAEDSLRAGELALTAGVDMDMQSGIYSGYLSCSFKEGKIDIETINAAVRRVLRLKFLLGLFDDPYRYLDKEREAAVVYSDEIMEHALVSARESVVLLKNKSEKGRKILPLSNPSKIAVIGPMADNQLDMLGSWHAAGDHTKVVTLLEGLKKKYTNSEILYAKGCDFYSDDRSGFREALDIAGRSDVVILAIGEDQEHSGEAASRSMIDIPGVQEDLAMALINTGKPVVVLIMAERPLTFPELNEQAQALFYAWHLGTRGGDALTDILSGAYNPSAKLVMSIPRNVGQVPIYYNYKSTGRPYDRYYKYTTKYIDVENGPLYPFGYGLSYTSFEYGDIELSDTVMGSGDTIRVSIPIRNTGSFDGEEIVQLYIRDMVASLTRPVKELKAFKKISLPRGEEATVQFEITVEDLKFVNGNLDYVAEPGDFKVMVGPDSERLKEAVFTLK